MGAGEHSTETTMTKMTSGEAAAAGRAKGAALRFPPVALGDAQGVVLARIRGLADEASFAAVGDDDTPQAIEARGAFFRAYCAAAAQAWHEQREAVR
jgi:hypothetical protein